MTVSINQEDNLGYCQVLDYAEQYHLDTAVIIWRTEDPDQATIVHEIVEKQMKLGEPADLRTTVDYTASFGTMAGCIFLAFGEDGIDRLDAMIIDNLAAALPCETELWLGTADDVRLAAVLPANENKRKEAPQTDLQ